MDVFIFFILVFAIIDFILSNSDDKKKIEKQEIYYDSKVDKYNDLHGIGEHEHCNNDCCHFDCD